MDTPTQERLTAPKEQRPVSRGAFFTIGDKSNG